MLKFSFPIAIMNPENQPKLFELIKSMTMSEKRYFKLSASTHKSETTNLKLFDALEEQTAYNESHLLNKLKGEGFIKDLAVAKNLLYNHILKVLRDYNSSDSDYQLMRNLLMEADILKQKGLIDHYVAVLLKAKKIAYKHEEFLVVAEIIDLQMSLFFEKDSVKISESEMNALMREEILVLEARAIEQKYRNLLYRLQAYYTSNHIGRKSEELSLINGIVGNELEAIKNLNPDSEIGQFSYRATYYFISIKVLYYFATINCLQSYLSTVELLDFLERNISHPNYQFRSHILAQSNNALLCIALGKYDECLATINKLRNIPVKSIHLKSMVFMQSYEKELKVYVTTGQYKKGIELIPELEKGLKLYEKTIPELYMFSLCSTAAELYFGDGNFQQSAFWLNKMLNHPQFKNTKMDFQCYARILSVIVQFEMGKQDLLEYSIRSTYRFLYMRQQLYKTESAFLNFFKKKSPGLHTQKLQIDAFIELKAELEEIMKDPFEHRALELFDFISWLESKITSRPFSEIISRKASLPHKLSSALNTDQL
jgi:hypothetical protein